MSGKMHTVSMVTYRIERAPTSFELPLVRCEFKPLFFIFEYFLCSRENWFHYSANQRRESYSGDKETTFSQQQGRDCPQKLEAIMIHIY